MSEPRDKGDIEWEKKLFEFREKNFAVKVEPSRWHPGEIALSITHNGYQWSTITLLPNEIDAVIKALEKHQQV